MPAQALQAPDTLPPGFPLCALCDVERIAPVFSLIQKKTRALQISALTLRAKRVCRARSGCRTARGAAATSTCCCWATPVQPRASS